MNNYDIAALFGSSLDKDEFEITKGLLSQDCQYSIGMKILRGPDEICQSYEQNMIEGRKKLDKLEWGESNIEKISESEYYVHFTDHLGHKGIEHIHRCKQKLTISGEMIIQIEHIDNMEEQNKLDAFYRQVGLK